MAKGILGDYQGYLQTDGYEVYDRACEKAKNVVHVGCWAHVRRKFFDAKKNSKTAGSADMALAMIGRIYRAEAEREVRKDPQQFLERRRQLVEPILVELRGWLEQRESQVPPQTLLGKAVGYALGHWSKLVRYLEHPAMSPDTNACEGAIRPFVLGRKNWLFSGSPRGAAASATLFSIIETTKANGHEPYWYTYESSSKTCRLHERTRRSWLWPLSVPLGPDSAGWGSSDAYAVRMHVDRSKRGPEVAGRMRSSTQRISACLLLSSRGSTRKDGA